MSNASPLSALRLKSGAQFERPLPQSEAGQALLEALDAILAIDPAQYPQTVALVQAAYAQHASDEISEHLECLEALRWFWSSAQPTRWEARLLDGWRYRGGDWWGFNATLMDAGAFVAPEASFPALRHLIEAVPSEAREGILTQRWAYLRERGLNVNASDPDAEHGARSLIEAFAEQPKAVALLLNRMDADPLPAYARLRANARPATRAALELLEDKLGLDDAERITRPRSMMMTRLRLGSASASS
jgi:hypothetical protein